MKSSKSPRHFSALARRSGEPPISWLMKLKLDRPGLISLAAGFTDNESLPVDEVRSLVNDLFRHPGNARAALQYGSTIGLPSLRRELFHRWQRQDKVDVASTRATADDVVITSGSQQLLYLVTEVLCDPGDIVLVEDPTYFVYLGILESMGVRARGFNTLDQLKNVLQSLHRARQLSRLKMVYLVTYFRNPTGTSWTMEDKVEAMSIVRRYEKLAGHPIYVVDDAAYRDLRFEGQDAPSFKSIDPGNTRVIYAGTLTKPFATGLKIGYGILPEPVRRSVLRSKGNHDFGSSNFVQTLLAHALADGMYDRHLPKIATAYKQKRDTMIKALQALSSIADIRFETPRGGLYIWLELPKTMKTGAHSALFRRALDAGVLFVPGEMCYCADPNRPIPRHFIRLSFGAPTDAQIKRGIRHLCRCV